MVEDNEKGKKKKGGKRRKRRRGFKKLIVGAKTKKTSCVEFHPTNET
jgi:hypothetical protein